MRTRDRIALTLPSFMLRLMLGGTFIWAGLGKIIPTQHYTPEQSARLVALGAPLAPDKPAPEPQPAASLPDTGDAATPAPQPAEEPKPAAPAEPLPDAPAADPATDAATDPDAGSARAAPPNFQWTFVQNAEPEPAPELAPEPETKPAEEVVTPPPPTPAPMVTASPADYPLGSTGRKVYGLALMLDDAATPKLDKDSVPVKPIWPAALGSRPWPVVLAWAVALVEIIAGFFLLVGFLTRLSALNLAAVMGVAIWLTQIGPAVQSGSTSLGFLPNHALYDTAAWSHLLWQLALFAAALGVFLLGSGPIGIDHALFRPRRMLFEQPPPRKIHRSRDETIP